MARHTISTLSFPPLVFHVRFAHFSSVLLTVFHHPFIPIRDLKTDTYSYTGCVMWVVRYCIFSGLLAGSPVGSLTVCVHATLHAVIPPSYIALLCPINVLPYHRYPALTPLQYILLPSLSPCYLAPTLPCPSAATQNYFVVVSLSPLPPFYPTLPYCCLTLPPFPCTTVMPFHQQCINLDSVIVCILCVCVCV